jgi:hypothetical protein
VDEILSGRQNLVMFGRLYHLPVHVARRRADELLGQFRLAEVGGKPVRQYSGGMRGLPEDLARPAHLAGYARNHWGIGNREHYVRDKTFGEDLQRVRAGNQPNAHAAIRNLITGVFRRAGFANITHGRRYYGRDDARVLARYGYT